MDGRGEGIRALDLDLEARIIDVDVGISVADLMQNKSTKSVTPELRSTYLNLWWG